MFRFLQVLEQSEWKMHTFMTLATAGNAEIDFDNLNSPADP